jgi:hypothetical protein
MKTKPLAALLTMSVLATACGNGENASDDLARKASELVFSPDNRTAMTDSFFTNNPQWRAFGLLNIGGAWCSATHFMRNHIITARHCALDTDIPNITFRPAFVGQQTSSNFAARPSIRAKRLVPGTGTTGHINEGGTYLPGNEWLIVELDPATYQKGTGGTGIPSFPTSFTNWPTIGLTTLPKPIPAAGVTVTSPGYAADFLGANNAAGLHQNCKIRKDGVCSPQASEGQGIILTDCDVNPGASGGPVVTGGLSNPRIVGTFGGGQSGVTSTWTESNANKHISSNGFAFAPVRAAGFTATMSNNNTVLLGISSDSTQTNGIRQVNLLSADGYRPADQWYDFKDAGTVGLTFGRLTSARTIDGHAWVFGVANGEVWNKIESSPGVWINWGKFFAGSAMANNPADLEAQSAGTTAMQLYTIGQTSGTIRTRRKLNTWDAAWEAEVSIGVLSGAKSIAASSTDGFQQIFVTTSTGIQTKWEINAPSSNTWSSWQNFADGLPSGLTMVDIAAGIDTTGRMDVYLLAKNSTQTFIFQRAKTQPQSGSAWGAWVQLETDPDLNGATQVEIMTRSGVTGFAPRLVVIRDGVLWTRRYNADPDFPDNWVPLYAAANVTCP